VPAPEQPIWKSNTPSTWVVLVLLVAMTVVVMAVCGFQFPIAMGLWKVRDTYWEPIQVAGASLAAALLIAMLLPRRLLAATPGLIGESAASRRVAVAASPQPRRVRRRPERPRAR
jgi:hypothetical protein